MISAIIIRLDSVEVVISCPVGHLSFRDFRLVAGQRDHILGRCGAASLLFHRFDQLVVLIVAVILDRCRSIQNLCFLNDAVDVVVDVRIRTQSPCAQLGQLGQQVAVVVIALGDDDVVAHPLLGHPSQRVIFIVRIM